MSPPGFDIFCRVVDNYGDIGVCWRLARQLSRHPAAGPVRLWVDDLASFARIERRVDPGAARQCVADVELLHWTEPGPAVTPHRVVIEAFACSPPADFVARMRGRGCLWINLEYLSAEDWVEGCHGLPSLQANGLEKYFFFPGFTEATGGLLREPGLAAEHAEWLSRPELRWRLLSDIGMPAALIDRLRAGARQAFVFCYGDAPAGALAQALARSGPAVAIVPRGVLPGLAAMRASMRASMQAVMPAMQAVQADAPHIFESPFVDQQGFDRLLWSSDLNIVRGEDSLVRAIWAGRPFLWHIYPQQGGAHLAKLDAWLARTGFDPSVGALMRAWNTGDEAGVARGLEEALQADAWSRWRQQAALLRRRLGAKPGLVERLLAFCAEKTRSG